MSNKFPEEEREKTRKPSPDWQFFCNLLKLAVWTLNNKEFLISDAYQRTIHILITSACQCVCCD